MSNKVYMLPPQEDWICDRLVQEFRQNNADINVANPSDSDIIWLFSDWAWRQVPLQLLNEKKVIATIHHVVPEKFGSQQRQEFLERDKFITAYTVPNFRTCDFVSQLTRKPIHIINYWANQYIWKPTASKTELRKKFKLPDTYIIGSFQRDTEGHDLISPKLEKGPDLFIDAITKYNEWIKDIHVLLAGWRRQYVVTALEKLKISYTYIERPPQQTINELYQTLDLYPVTSRHEGGPQSLIECGLIGIKAVSRPVGIAEMVLPVESVADDVTTATPTVPNVKHLMLPAGFQTYKNLIESI